MTSTPKHRSACTLSARLLLAVGILLTGVLPDRAEEALSSRGEALYRTRCASCHEGAWHARLTPTRCGNSGLSG